MQETRRSDRQRKRTPVWVWVLIGCGGLVALVGLAAVTFAGYALWEVDRQVGRGFDPAAQPWRATTIPRPDAGGALAFERKHIHPMLAEYERRLRLEQADGAAHRIELPPNYGGRTRINVYWHESSADAGPWLRLEDHVGRYVVDLGGADLGDREDIPPERPGRYIGLLDGRQGPDVRFVPPAEAPEEPIEQVVPGP